MSYSVCFSGSVTLDVEVVTSVSSAVSLNTVLNVVSNEVLLDVSVFLDVDLSVCKPVPVAVSNTVEVWNVVIGTDILVVSLTYSTVSVFVSIDVTLVVILLRVMYAVVTSTDVSV